MEGRPLECCVSDAASTPLADERALVTALRANDESAYERLVRSQLPRLLAVTRRILGNEDDARDAVQEAFLSAFKGLARFDGTSRLSTWLHRIAVNAALMKIRSPRRKPEQPIEGLLPRFLEDGHQADPPAAWQESAEEVLSRKEARERVRRAIEELPESYRTVILLRDIEELDTEETARLLGVSEGVVKTRLHRARQALRTLLDPVVRGGEV
jgi:RNA polymerase sigma-70 factor (ECF subfamily)